MKILRDGCRSGRRIGIEEQPAETEQLAETGQSAETERFWERNGVYGKQSTEV
ncbi:MAG: hypothetical protein PUG60_11815 [Lachnospiraceae bacterium]|nr:hypothetical protein [Lachnospiraceae bacterium]